MSYTKELYLSTTLLEELNMVTDLGLAFNRNASYPDVFESLVALNAIAMKDDMYPKNKLTMLSFCNVDELNCVIVGGMPDLSRIDDWTGSGYSYKQSDGKTNILHEKIMDDTAYIMTKYNRGDFYESSNEMLQNAGILLLHDVLSVTKNYANECRKAWRPIIARLLNFISEERPEVPIIFTSSLSYATFNTCCCDSKNIFSLKLNTEKMKFHENPKVFKYVEDMINRDKEPSKKIIFSDLIESYDQ